MANIDKIDVDGTVYDITAAKLTKTETVLQTNQVPYVSRASLNPEGFSGYVREKIVGGSIAWNQKIPKTATTTTYAGITFTNNNDGSWTLTGTATNNNSFKNIQTTTRTLNFLPNHVYYVSAKSGKDNVGLAIMQTNLTNWTSKYIFNTESIVKISNYTITDPSSNYGCWARLQVSNLSGTDIGTCTYYPMVVDLTLMFGTAIADYIYSLETATAGTGVDYLKSLGLLTKPYYEYDDGSLQSVCIKEKKITGKNLVESEIESANINSSGTIVSGTTRLCIARVIANQQYTISWGSDNSAVYAFYTSMPTSGSTSYDRARAVETNTNHYKTITAPINGYIVFRSGGSYTQNQCEPGSSKTDFELYHIDTIQLSSSELRGIVLKDASNNLYHDGDEYTSDGKIKCKYKRVNMGTLNWTYSTNNYFYTLDLTDKAYNQHNICAIYTLDTSTVASMADKTFKGSSSNYNVYVKDSAYTDAATFKTAMSGVYLVYELATPTEKTVSAYQNPQYAKDGTEEFVDGLTRDMIVPVGHITEYMGATAGEYQVFPTMPVDEGTYLLTANKNNVTWERKNDWTLLSRFIDTNVRIPVDIITNANELMLEVSIYSDYSTYSYSDVKILRIKDISSELTDTLLSFGYYHNDNDRAGAVFHMEINSGINSVISKESAWINNYDESTISFFISVYYR